MTHEDPPDPEYSRDQLVASLLQGLVSAHSDTVSELVQLSTHRGLYELGERLRQMYVDGYDHIALVDLFKIIDEIHTGLDRPDPD